MKNIYVTLFLSFLVLTSCSTEETPSIDDTNSQSDIIALFEKAMQETGSSEEFVQYDLRSNSLGALILDNPTFVARTRSSETYNSYRKYKNSVSIRFEDNTRVAVTVCCTTDGDTYECSTCPDTAGQGICILEALNACIDNGGCGVVCPTEKKTVVYDPKNLEFIIVKS
jgi:hypothetical protein